MFSQLEQFLMCLVAGLIILLYLLHCQALVEKIKQRERIMLLNMDIEMWERRCHQSEAREVIACRRLEECYAQVDLLQRHACSFIENMESTKN